MKKMGLNEIRQSYLNFFRGKEHYVLPSFSVVPKGDKSLLLINAGMAPLKPYFTGLAVPPSKRVATCQKCIRTGDIDVIGLTSRHVTFFEMLGNFSFGDYFKNEIIPWAWEYVTDVLSIPKDKLYVTIYEKDDEAFEIWKDKTDIDTKRIFRLGKKDNFWEHGVGPCGPCTEIHFDRGEGAINTREEFEAASDADRVIEFWNLVFTQFNREEDGTYSDLDNPNIDTGMGLERMAAIMQGVDSIFEIDTMKAILDEVCKKANRTYKANKNEDVSLRIITDHVRSVSIMIGDGVLPSNEGRGYVLRRLLRRAARHGRLLGVEGTFLNELCDVVIETLKGEYTELAEKKDYIKKVIKLEEERFAETIDAGTEILISYIDEIKNNNENVLSGEKAFKLYDTYGFPYELTEEICKESNIEIDKDAFLEEMSAQKNRARAARGEHTYMGKEISSVDNISNEIVTEFVGYDNIKVGGKVLSIIKDDEFVNEINSGDKAIIVVDKTPFYAEMGGQIGDRGIAVKDGFKAVINDTQKNISDKIVHHIEVEEGTLRLEDEVELIIENERRRNVCKNHTATHMLHEALRSVLGEHVNQSGSYVDENRLRFDFTHFTAMTKEEIETVEEIVNDKIMEAYNVATEEMTIAEAKERGAMALFDEKYGDKVRVVFVGDYSTELCGGTHVRNSGEIGLLKIISESGVAAGIRRIEAVTGKKALEYVDNKISLVNTISSTLKCNEKDLAHRIDCLLGELKGKEKELEAIKKELSKGLESELLNNVAEINGVKSVVAEVKDIDGGALRELAEKLRDKLVSGVVVLASDFEGKALFVAMASKDIAGKKVHAGNIVKEAAKIAGGGGGGRPDMAQAGGKNPEKIKDALIKVEEVLKEMVQ